MDKQHKRYDHTLPGIGGRRAHERHKIPADVMVIPLDGQAEPFWARAEDVCARGVFVNATQQPPIDSVLMLKIHMSSGDERRPLRIKARVVHRLEGAGFGCIFIEMTSTTSRTLSELVAGANSAPHPNRTLH